MATAQTALSQEPVRKQGGLAQNVIESFPWLPCDVAAEIPVPGFSVGDLLKLRVGAVVQTGFPATSDIPLHVNKLFFGRGQFELIEGQIAVRITEFS
jgi:flagellar motor switch/type III secretory pathway protein FliN